MIRKTRSLLCVLCLGVLLPLQAQTQETKPEPQTPGLISSLLEKAKTYLGTPYRYGGTTPKGFDCSGFVRFVFNSFGFGLERASGSQANQGEAIDLSQIQPGDLLFFKTRGQKNGISHVGIYLGEGQFIHAGSWGGPGKGGVKIGELDSTYYANRLVSARRILTQPTGTTEVLQQLLPSGFLKQDKEQ